MLPLGSFLSFIEQHQLFKADDKILLAVSGGRDSVLMVQLFNEAKLCFGIAHCNFGLRGEESDNDEKFVAELAAGIGVPFFSVRFETSRIAAENKISIQMAARDLRYSWLEEIRKEKGYHKIALAHHGSDVTETILLNLTRGTGIAGLHGIKPCRGDLIRPLLFLSRAEVDNLINENQISYREDSSNLSAKYARNKIRLNIIPQLKQINPSIDSTFEKNSRRFAQIEDFLSSRVEQLRQSIFKQVATDHYEIPLAKLKNLYPLQLLLFELLKPFHFTEAVLEDLALSWDGAPGKLFESSTHRLLLDRSVLLLEPKLHSTFREVNWPEEVTVVHYEGEAFSVSEIEIASFKPERVSEKAFFDRDQLVYPLMIRPWTNGDVFHPFGMKGKKKVSDFLREQKLPLTQKRSVPVLVNGNGDVLWIIGYRSDNRYKVGPETKKVATFEKHHK